MATKNDTEKKPAETKKKASTKSTKNSQTSSKGSKKKNSKLGKVLTSIISILVVLLAVAWFLGGKPYVEIGAEGITIVQTEDPIIYHIPEFIRGEYPPVTDYSETSVSTKDTAETAPAAVVPASTASASGKSGSGTKGSFAGDLGYAEDDPLFFGNPTDAVADTKSNTNYLMIKPQYTLSYNTETLCPNWAAWHLDTSNMGPADRMDDFRPDTDLPEGWYGVKKADYQYNAYGFDRGHVCPSADRTTTKEDNSMTFLMTNMVPQSPDNNRIIWMHFENFERELANAGNEVYIIAGPNGTGGTSGKGTFDSIPIKLKSGEVLQMNVPATTWKVVLVIPAGTGDMGRVNKKDAYTIAINVPNQMGMQKTGDWEQYLTSVDEIEALTGYDFFELLPDDIEDALEAAVYVRK
ncbi:MAG: DNA/RNA non-specific endonuclease [Treponema sp.]|nr:DNA/RNA non-specific endonuclease [Treponema sp.]